METILATFLIFCLAWVGMVGGMLLGGRGLRGSCRHASPTDDEQDNTCCGSCSKTSESEGTVTLLQPATAVTIGNEPQAKETESCGPETLGRNS